MSVVKSPSVTKDTSEHALTRIYDNLKDEFEEFTGSSLGDFNQVEVIKFMIYKFTHILWALERKEDKKKRNK